PAEQVDFPFGRERTVIGPLRLAALLLRALIASIVAIVRTGGQGAAYGKASRLAHYGLRALQVGAGNAQVGVGRQRPFNQLVERRVIVKSPPSFGWIRRTGVFHGGLEAARSRRWRFRPLIVRPHGAGTGQQWQQQEKLTHGRVPPC